jgi:translation initiation factor IF-1
MSSMNKEVIEVQGIVTDALPNASFRVLLDSGQEVYGFVSGKIRKNRIRILQGDRVLIEFSPYDLTKGRIVRRLS